MGFPASSWDELLTDVGMYIGADVWCRLVHRNCCGYVYCHFSYGKHVRT